MDLYRDQGERRDGEGEEEEEEGGKKKLYETRTTQKINMRGDDTTVTGHEGMNDSSLAGYHRGNINHQHRIPV